ncbi:MAG: hypothetical protein Q7Q71_03325 [Verrucomicrobiota bacterium JB023]|nr:hypothetical protein [Verrucomicrobiota bacterium JB023]
MNKNWIYATVFVVAVLLGVGWHDSTKDSNPEDLLAGSLPTKSSRRVLSAKREQEVAGLTRLQQEEGGEESWLRWLAELENATLADMPRFVSHVPDHGPARDLVVERWLDLGPDEAIDYFQKKFAAGEMGAGMLDPDVQFVAILFDAWAKRDLDGAIAALEAMEAFPFLEKRIARLAELLAGKEPERAIRLAMRHNVHRSGRTFLVRGGRLRDWIQRDPETVAELIFAWGREDYALKDLAKHWGASSPKDAIAFGLARGGSNAQEFVDEVFQSWARRNYGEAAQWLSDEASDEEASLFTAPLVGVWGESDPQAALGWCEENLEGMPLVESVGRLVIGSVDSKGVSAGDLLARIDDERVHREVAVRLAHSLWGKGLDEEGAKLVEERLAWFDHIREPQTWERIIPNLTLLGEYEAGAKWFREFVEREEAAQLGRYASESLLLGIAGQGDYAGSLAAVELMNKPHQEELYASLFSGWVKREPEAAADWLENLDGTDSRRAHLGMDLAQRFFYLVNRHPQDHDTVASLAKTVDPAFRQLVIDSLRRQQANSASSLRTDGTEVDFDMMIEALSD